MSNSNGNENIEKNGTKYSNVEKHESQSPLDDLLDSRFECPICIHWLNEPVLTSCGHRFCKSCIESWLESQGQCCPLDNKPLSKQYDIFPDNFTRREISQIRIDCVNASLGCTFADSPHAMDRHLSHCPFRQDEDVMKCPFYKLNCRFTTKSRVSLNEHTQNEMAQHMNLLLGAVNKTTLADEAKNWDPQKSRRQSYPHRSSEVGEDIIKAMYERIVVLEQRCREQDAKIENLTRELNTKCLIDPRYSNGVLLWEIAQFASIIEQMKSNLNTRFYSRECYTSPYGYKFCARINIPPRKEIQREFLSLHIHLMQSENDFHLDWPFKGRIKINMIHPKNQQISQSDTIMSKPEILAFHQPKEKISPRGFGFVEYASVFDIFNKGFVENDKLVLKIQMNIV